MFFPFIDPLYLLMLLPGMVLAGIATYLTQSTFSKYSKVSASSGMTGAQAARRLLDSQGLASVGVEMTKGFLSDHYDPSSRVLRLSPKVYGACSLSAIGVACHEAGHALQHADHYMPLTLRTALVPATQFGTNAAYIFFIIGLLLHSMIVAKIGVVLFAVAVLFALVTLPVEWNASSRAKQLMISAGIVGPMEQERAGKVLNAAFLTYIAAAVTALLQLLYFLLRLGLLGGSDD